MEASTVGVALAPYGQSFSVHETVAKLIDLLSSMAEFRKTALWDGMKRLLWIISAGRKVQCSMIKFLEIHSHLLHCRSSLLLQTARRG